MRQIDAIAKVGMEVLAGRMARLSEVYVKCTDCDARATCYDHREYAKPLDVQPVCSKCNHSRGPAIDAAQAKAEKLGDTPKDPKPEVGPCRNCGAKWPRKGKGMPIRCPRCGVQKWQQARTEESRDE